MLRKVSTLLDESLYRRIKVESARQGKQISELIGEAVEQYLAAPAKRRATSSVVAESWGAVTTPRDAVRAVLEDEDGVLDA